MSINAYALSDGAYLSSDVARTYFGDEIQAKYWTSNGYVDVTYRYYSTCKFYSASNGLYVPSGFDDTYLTGTTFIMYSANLTGLLSDPTQIVIDIEPQYRLTDTYQIHCAIGLKGSSYSVSAYNSSAWDWYFSGSNQHFEQINDSTHSSVFKDRKFYDYYNMVFADMSSQSSTSGYSLRATFPVADTSSYLVIGCPYVSIGSSGGSGLSGLETGSSGSSGSSGGSVDLYETNGLLSSIISALDGLVDSIAALFVPDEDYIDAVCDDLADMLLEAFGGIESDMLTNCIADLMTHGSTQSITFPRIQPPGTAFYINERTVSLKPAAGSTYGHQFYETVALGIDLVATCLFLNMIFNKLREIIIGKKIVEVENDVD